MAIPRNLHRVHDLELYDDLWDVLPCVCEEDFWEGEGWVEY